jgi:hypothetical protein
MKIVKSYAGKNIPFFSFAFNFNRAILQRKKMEISVKFSGLYSHFRGAIIQVAIS